MEGQTLCWADIPVIDLDRAIAFYTAVLGAPVTKETGDPGVVFGLLPHEDNNVSACLTVGGNNLPSLTGPLIYLSVVGRLHEAVEAVSAHGGTVQEPPQKIGLYGYRAVIIDSEGNRIALHSASV